jgi:NAD(P) transhydrogenase subunit alpha
VHGVAVDPLITNLTVFVLAVFVGYHVVWNVTPALHTPLMSVTNAISSVIIVGAILAAGATAGGVGSILGAVAVVLVAINTFGGFLVTERMLEMIKKKEPKKYWRPRRSCCPPTRSLSSISSRASSSSWPSRASRIRSRHARATASASSAW